MSAITQRGKRKTAGRRMNVLVGKAQEEDDTFWGHDTWAEGEDSGNESFRDSDEDSALKKDEFDSDFDDSESDHEEEERAAGEEEERELKRQERSKSKTKGYMEVASKRPIKGKGKGTRVVGDGINAGIVLNFPPSAGGAPLPTPAAAPLAPAATAVAPTKAPAKKPAKRITMASTRAKRGSTINKRLRESTTKASAQPPPPTRKVQKTGTSKKSGKRVFTQEELLLEAVRQTEPENARWLAARKRMKDIEDQDKEAMSLREKQKGPLIQKYHSKRGCLKTLTFPDMDSVPEILTRQKAVLEKPKETLCVITGKPARYKDPKTNLHYFDLAAFKELRRRLEAKEPLDQRKKSPPKSKAKTKSPKENSNSPPKAKAGPKPDTNGETPADAVPSTPKPTATVSGIQASGGPDLPALSPSGRRVSPRARKPSEKVRENIVSNPQLSSLVKLGLSSQPKSPPTIPNGNTKSNSDQPGPAPKSSPSNGNGKTLAMPQTSETPKPETTTSSAVAKVNHTKTPSTTKQKTKAPVAKKTKPAAKHTKTSSTGKPKTTTAKATKAKPAGPKQAAKAITAAAKPSAVNTKPDEKVYVIPKESETSAKGQTHMTQSQLIMQVIEDYNKKHPEVKE